MKIGILTYHRSHNYGALLQAIALRNVLSEMGHEVAFVDYWPGYHKRVYSQFKWLSACNIFHPLRSFNYITNRIVSWKSIKQRITNINCFIKTYISPYCSSTTDKYDIIICGSDQIWRKQPEHFGYNPVYFGKNNYDTPKQISYAASIGMLPKSKADEKKVIELVKNLDGISVRENDLKQFLSKGGIQNVEVTLDPTLLLSADKWNRIIPQKRLISKNYALYYEVSPNCFNEDQMRQFCDKHNLMLLILRTKHLKTETETEMCSVAPDIFVNLIRYADFVFSSSFHGLALSIINHKNFLCSVSSGKSRLTSLMENLGISEHFIEPMTNIPSDVASINYKLADIRLDEMRKKSFHFLDQYIYG